MVPLRVHEAHQQVSNTVLPITSLVVLHLQLKHDLYENGIGYEFRPPLMS